MAALCKQTPLKIKVQNFVLTLSARLKLPLKICIMLAILTGNRSLWPCWTDPSDSPMFVDEQFFGHLSKLL